MLKKIITYSFTIPILALIACTQVRTEDEAPSPIDYAVLEQELKDIFELSQQLFQSKDVDGLVDRFTDDGVLKIPGRPAIIGREALRANYEGTVALDGFELVIKPIVVKLSENGDMAYAVADFSVSFNTPDGVFNESGTSQVVFVRQDDRWKIAAENLSAIVPSAEQKTEEL